LSYVDGIHDRGKDIIHVVERVDGQRVYTEYPANYVFYYDDPRGKFRTIFDTPVSRFSSRSSKEFQKELNMAKNSGKRIWESDFKPVFRCLEENYLGKDSPKLHTAFLDIEVDFHKEKGYAKPEDPFNAITAISVYLDWIDKLVTLVLPPKSYSWETAQSICDQYDNCILFDREEDMLTTFFDLVDDADILSGWNSEGFDIPYIVMRTVRILSKDDTRRFCLWNQVPKQRMFERFGKEQMTFDTVGRVHLDYMQLYIKYTYEERHSYSLDAIAEYELNEHKTPYEGTLDQLYNQDFSKFIEYNRQDTVLLSKLDTKLRFIDLANELAHENTVLLMTTMGAVAVTEQAITNEAHSRGMIVPNRKARDEQGETQAAGAYVAYPRKGIHKDIGAIDINSLYPSAIRALNMGPETVVGQIRPTLTDAYLKEKMKPTVRDGRTYVGCSLTEAWEGLFGTLEYTAVMNMDPTVEVTIDWEADGNSTTHTAEEVWRAIFEGGQPWLISANGTIFRYDKKGVVPGLLARWYAERKELQAKKKEATDPAQIAFWDKRQLVKKINLNSLYGAILNAGCRFFDHRIGQSTTLTGRVIARHMDAHVNEAITGKYDHVGEAVIYGDTDSVYFSAWPIIQREVESGNMVWDRDTCVALYDRIADSVNESFPAFMERACHCPLEMGALIKGGRELVASQGLFITKKRYAVLIYDMEGTRYDLLDEASAKKKGVIPGVGKVKAMGLDLKRSDTPKIMQEFLMEILTDLLTDKGRDLIVGKVKDFKQKFADLPPWEKGTPKRVNNLTSYGDKERNSTSGKTTMPGHVRAAINYNRLKRLYNDNISQSIVDGMKTIVCKLKDNPMGYKSVGYPTDIAHIPQWFKDLPFDNDLMETTIVDQKVENLLGVLDWDIRASTDISSTFESLFSFE
jgi:DNA polymerase elongation subunit (family B)